RVPTFSIKRVRVRPDLVLPTLLGAGLVIAAFAAEPWLTLSGLGLIYLGSLPASVIVARRMRLQEEAQRAGTVEPAPPPPADTAPDRRILSLGPRPAKTP